VKWVARLAALYNLAGGATLVIPGSLALVGVDAPAGFWLWLPALLGSFGAIVLWLSSFDLGPFGSFVYWNAIVRLTWVVVTFALGFPASVGAFATALAVGDLVLALACLLGLPRALRRSHWDLVRNRRPSTVNSQSSPAMS
jgi:hypothetical protein